MLSINCFKKLCLKANTKKADEIHDFYIQLEDLTHEIVSEQSQELKLQLGYKNVELENKKNQKQDMLLKEFGKICSILYIMLIKTLEDCYIIKVGESRHGILERYKQHSYMYPECIILDVFSVRNSDRFEKFIHKKLSQWNYKELPGHEKEKELFKVGNDLTYDYILRLINDNIRDFNDIDVDFSLLQLENEKLKLELEKQKFYQSNNLHQINIKELKKEITLELEDKFNKEFEDKFNKELDLLRNEIKELKIKSDLNLTNSYGLFNNTNGPKIKQINPENMTLVKTWETMTEVIKNLNVPRSSLTKAIKENTIYNEFRWSYDNSENIEPTRPKIVQK